MSTCKVCNHPEKIRIEALQAAGTSLEKIAAQFELTKDAVWRHCTNHVTDEQRLRYLVGPGKLEQLLSVAVDQNRGLLDYLGIVRSILLGQLDKQAGKNEPYAVAALSAQLTSVLREIGKTTGEVNTLAGSTFNFHSTVNVMNSPAFAALQAGLVRVAQAHPSARGDILALLRDLDAEHGQQAPLKQIEGVAAHV